MLLALMLLSGTEAFAQTVTGFSYGDEFNSYGTGNLHEVGSANWIKEGAADVPIPIVASGLTPATTHHLDFSRGGQTHDYRGLPAGGQEMKMNEPFYFSTYFSASALGSATNRIRTVLRIDDKVSGDQWVRQQIALVDGQLVARLGLGGSGSDDGKSVINADQRIQFVVRGEWNGVDRVTYSWTLKPGFTDAMTIWQPAGEHVVNGTPRIGRLFISSIGTNRVSVGPIRIGTTFENIRTEEVGNTVPTLSSIGNLTASAGEVTVVPVTATDADGDPLSFELMSGPDFLRLVDSENGTAELSITPGSEAAGSYTGITVSVSDGTDTRSETFDLLVTPAGVSICSPVSLLPCEEIAVSLPYLLTFEGEAGGLADAAGLGTGFTMVDNHSQPRLTQDGEPTYPEVNGYEPGRLQVANGNLAVEAGKGIFYVKRTGDNRTNTQINTLGAGLNGLTTPFEVETQLLNIRTGTGSAQAGIWFGIDEDNFVKLNVNNDGQVELRQEIEGVTLDDAIHKIQAAVATGGRDVRLRMAIDPATRVITAYYAFDGGAETQLTEGATSSLTLPADFFTGRTLSSEVPALSFAGVYSTYRNGSPFTAIYDYFRIREVPQENTAPALAAVGDLSATAGEATTVELSATDADAGDLLSFALAGAPDFMALTDNGDGTARLDITPGAVDAGTYSGITVSVTDGQLSDEATVSLVVEPGAFAGCSPISPLDCDAVAVGLPVSLSFDGTDGGILGTGFTMVDPPSNNLYPPTPSDPAVPGLEADLLALANGSLVITSTKGINYYTPAGSSETNSQVNALGVGIVAPAVPFELTTELAQPNFAGSAGNNSQQGGLWFGLNEDNYAKLVVSKASATEQKVQLYTEYSEAGQPNGLRLDEINSGFFPTGGAPIHLRLEVDPATGAVAGYYRVGDGPEQRVAQNGRDGLPVPAAFFAGTDLDVSAATDALSYAGLFTTHRRAAVDATVDFAFASFGVAELVINTPPTLADATFTVAEDAALTTVIGTVTGTDADAGAVLTYAITAGNDAGVFALDATTGELTLSGALDFEATTGYALTVSVSDGEDSTTGTIIVEVTNVNEAPTASFTANPTAGTAPQLVNFDATASSDPDGDVLTYAWDFGDGTTGTEASANRTYDVGTYEVTLVVSDPGGLNSETVRQTLTFAAGNVPPTLAAVGNLQAQADEVTEVTLSATDPNPGDVLHFTVTGAPAFTELIDNRTGEATLRLSPGVADVGDYADITVSVTDGTDSDAEVITITVVPPACNPLSLLPCNALPVALPFALTFDGSEGGLAATGFPMVLDHSAVRLADDGPATYPEVNGYEPNRLTVANGQLVIAANRGIAYVTNAISSNVNSQINSLGAGITDLSQTISIETELPALTTGGGAAQAGVWFGVDDNNFVKLDVNNDRQIELRREINGQSANTTTDALQFNTTTTGQTIGLRLVVDPVGKTLSAYYRIGDGAEQRLTQDGLDVLALPEVYLQGRTYADGADAMPFAGVYATYRNGNPFNATYNYFNITPVAPDNQAPVFATADLEVAEAAPVGTVVGTLQATDADGDVLTYAITAGNTGDVFALNATSGELTLAGTLDHASVPEYSLTVTASDGRATTPATQVVRVRPGALPCSPLSTLPCADLAVSLPFVLPFDGTEGGLAGTGFTLATPPAVNQYPATPSNPDVPGLEAGLLDVSGGTLSVTATKGINFESASGSTDNNTQVNALGVGIDVSDRKVEVGVDLLQPDFAASAGNNSQQAGLWLGLDYDNFVKLVVLKTSNTQQRIQMLLESTDPANPAAVVIDELNSADFPYAGDRVSLRLELDPATRQISGFYRVDGGPEVQLNGAGGSSLTAPAGFITGDDHDANAATPGLTYAGVSGTLRRAAATPALVFGFDNFTVKEAAPPAALAFTPDELRVQSPPGVSVPEQTVTLATNDDGSPAVLLSEDPDASDWLILPENASVGSLTFGFAANLAEGTYSTTVIAQTPGYLPAELPITLVIAPDKPILAVTPGEVVVDDIVNGASGPSFTVTVTNTGNIALENGTLALTGSTAFSLVEGSLPAGLAPNQSATLTLRFSAPFLGSHLGLLTVSGSNAEAATVDLRGLGKTGTGGSNEPSLQHILDTYGLPIAVGDAEPNTNVIDLPSGATYNDLLGDEIAAERFERATNAPVTVELLATYGPEQNNPVVAFGWYRSGDPLSASEVFTVSNQPAGNGQTLRPALTGSTSFDPGSAVFGLYSRWPFFNNRVLHSEDALNTFSGAIPHHVRVYALPGEENAYVVATEEHVSGFDYQDIVVIVRNVKPSTRQPQITTMRVNFSDEATPAPAGYLQDYGQAYGDRGGRQYGWVVPGSTTPLNLVGNGRNRPPSPDVNTLTETLMHMQYGDTGGTRGPTDAGSWEMAVPNGTYEVSVQSGDADNETQEGTRHVLIAEGVQLLAQDAVLQNANYFSATAVVEVNDGRLTIDATGGFNTKLQTVTISPTDQNAEAYFSDVTIPDGTTNVSVTEFQIGAAVNTPSGYELDKNTLTGRVKLFEQTPGGLVEVPSNYNDTGGGDAVVLTPEEGSQLKYSTTYIFRIEGVEANRIGDLTDRVTFQTFTSSFTTASEADTNPPADLNGVSFTQVKGAALGEGIVDRFSSLVIGPDGKLYASTTGEVIKRWTIAEDGTLTDLEELTIPLTGSNHPITGARASDDRLIIGLTFAPEATADNLVAYITHSALTLSNGPEWDGKLTRLSGPDLGTVQDILVHLPRSAKDHLTNSVVIGPDNDLFIVQGSNSAGGSPDPAWANRPERLLAAAVLRLEVDKLPSQLPLDVFTTDNISVINAAPATGLTMSDGTYNPYSSDSPLTLYATGIRNAYDMVFHSNGWLYVPTNGTAGNRSNSPNTPASADYVTRDPSGLGVRRPNGTFFTDPTIPGVTGGETQKDWLFKSRGGSYHGHPNPYRGEYVLNHGGRAYSGLPGQTEASYRDVAKYPTDLGPDPNYLEVAFDFGLNKSPNGAIEYRSNAFNGKLKGMLMVVRFSGQDDILVMQPGNNSGDILQSFPDVPGLQGLDDPLEVVEDPRTGNLYAAQYDRDQNVNQQLLLLRADVPAIPQAEIVASPKELIFEITTNGEGQQTDLQVVTVRNNGSAALGVSNVALTGPNADQYTFSGPTSLTLAPGAAQEYAVTFAPELANTNLGYQEAGLTFTTDAEGFESFVIGLHGLKKAGFEGNEEPPLQDVVDALGLGIDVGWTTLANGTAATPYGDEVLVPLFEAAGPGAVGITPVARYSPAEELPYGWYTNVGGELGVHPVDVLASGLSEAQTLYPKQVQGVNSFDPLGAFFGIYTESNSFNRFNYSEDELNTGGVAHRVRVYPVRDRTGALQPNSYLVTFEDASNGDYQDYVFVLTNAKPYAAGAQVLSFNPQSLDVPAIRGKLSEARSAVLSSTSALPGSAVTLSANAPWVVLPQVTSLNTALSFAVDATGLANGTYEATVTATAPGFAPASLLIRTEVQDEVVFAARINFQDDSFTAPTGYTADVGLAYGSRGAGMTFGWINPGTGAPTDNTAGARGAERGVAESSSDDVKLLRSLNMFDRVTTPAAPRDWEMALPNGRYRVEVAAGDPNFYDSRHTIRAEGVVLIDGFAPSAGAYYRTGAAIVDVLDGKLTLDDVGATGEGNTKILYVTVAYLSGENAEPTVYATLDGTRAGDGSYRGSVDVSVETIDNSGSGIRSVRYSLDGDTYTEYTGAFTLGLPSGVPALEYTLFLEATDNNDNVGTARTTFTVSEASGALVRLENMVKVPGSNRGFPADDYYTFHRNNNPINSAGDVIFSHESSVMRIHNEGTADLVITELTTSNMANFTVTAPAIPAGGLTVAPGAFVDATVNFVTSGGAGKRLITETLRATSNADNGADLQATLRGSYMTQPEGNNEITAQQVFNAFGFTTEMGRNAQGTIIDRPSSDYPTPERVDSGAEGDMILSKYFVQADPGKPVQMIQLSALHGPGGAGTSLRSKNTGSPVGDMQYNHGGNYHQTLLPPRTNESQEIAGDWAASIAEAFEVSIASYRTSGGNATGQFKDQILGLRVYRVIDGDGNVVPNEYILNQDYIQDGCGEGSANCDWNDNTSYIINARPLDVPTATQIPDLVVDVEVAERYVVAGYFKKGYPGNKLTYSATFADGSALPAWIVFDAATATFTVTAPFSASAAPTDITVTATDYNLMKAASTFTLTVNGGVECGVDANADGTAKEIDCLTGTVQLRGLTAAGTYAWTGPNGFTSTEQNPTVSAPGVYTLAVGEADAETCGLTSTVTVGAGGTAVEYFADADKDGYGDAATSRISCYPIPGYVTRAGDCDDNNARVNPGAPEICDGLDNNCDGQVDEGLDCTENTAPVAVATATPASGTAPLLVTLDGSGSYDAEGTIAGYAWTWNGGSNTNATFDQVFDVGTYQVTLTVTDAQGLTDATVVTVTVTEPDTGGDGTTAFWLEAECAEVGAAYASESNAGASNGTVVRSPNLRSGDTAPADVADNRIRFTVDGAKAGTYSLFARIAAANPESDSYWVRVNGGSWYKWWTQIVNDGTLTWNRMPQTVSLQAGTNVIDFAYREGNARLDKLHLDLDATLPTGLGGEGTNCTPTANTAPVAVATATPASGTAPLLVTLDGSGSYDAEGPIASYAWTWNGGSNGNASFSNAFEAGTYDVTLTVTDAEGLTDATVVTITVEAPAPTDTDGDGVPDEVDNCPTEPNPGQEDSDGDGIGDACDAPANTAPVAVATATPASGTAPLLVTLDGSGSYDAEGPIASYAWTWNGGSSSSASFSNTFDTGTYAVTLTVTDTEGLTDATVVTITVEAPAPTDSDGDGVPDEVDNCPTAPNSDQKDSDNDGIGDACDAPDTGGDPVSAFWLEAECATVGSAYAKVADAAAANGAYVRSPNRVSADVPPADEAANRIRFTVDNAKAGTYQLFARISATPTSDSYWVRVNGGTWYKWWSRIVKDGSFAWNRMPQAVNLQAGTNTIDFAYREAGGKLDKLHLDTDATLPTGTGSAAGNCAPTGNTAPVAVATATPVRGTAPLLVALDGNGSYDAEGPIASYSWSWNGGSSNRASFTHTFAAGTYAVTLTVTDAGGLTNSTVVTITALEPTPTDSDGDGVPDGVDNCPTTPNSDQKDSDNDGIGDACDAPDTGGDPVSAFWLEAECATVGSAYAKVADAAAANGAYVRSPNRVSADVPPADEAANRIRFTVDNAKAGTYQLFARISATPTSDSYWVRVNGGTWYKWWSRIVKDGSFAWNRMPQAVNLQAGTNTIDFAYREAGGKLDKLHLDFDVTTPTGTGSAAGNCAPTGNTAPLAVAASSSYRGKAPLSVVLDGSGSYDAEGPIAGYRWDWNGGFATGVRPAVTFPDGIYTVTLTVTDQNGATDTDQITIISETPDTDADVTLAYEAECATLGTGWRTYTSSNASGSRYAVFTGERQTSVPTAADAGRQLTWNVTVPQTDDYLLYLRVSAPDPGRNSVWVRVDDGAWHLFWRQSDGTQLLTNSFEWRRVQDDLTPVTVSLTAGNHRITVANREPGTAIDKLQLTNVVGLPTGMGAEAGNCGTAVAQASALQWQPTVRTEGEASIEVFPNPTRGNASVMLRSDFTGRVDVRLYDATGRQIRRMAFDKLAEALQLDLEMRDLPPGVYRVETIEGDRRAITPIIKVR